MRRDENAHIGMRAPVCHRLAQASPGRRAQMPALGIATNQEADLHRRERRQQLPPPRLGAAFHRRQVAPARIMAGKTEPHGHDGDAGGIVELCFGDAHPGAQAHARGVVERCPGPVGQIARRLAGHQDTCGGTRLKHGVRRVRHVIFA